MDKIPMSYSERAKYGNMIRKQKSLILYSENPNLCLFCKSPILPKENEKLNVTKKKKYCNSSCFAKHSNTLRKKKLHYCTLCSNSFTYSETSHSNRKICPTCRNLKKDNYLLTPKNELSHSVIRLHARTLMKTEKQCCSVCGYSKHVEVCHIKPVSSFSPLTPLGEINSKDNLLILCPNCHWEFDNIKGFSYNPHRERKSENP